MPFLPPPLLPPLLSTLPSAPSTPRVRADCTARRAQRGFTVIELLIGVLLVGILAALALPTFNSSIRKGRRSDAAAALSAAQQAQERWRTNNPQYGSSTDIALPGLSPSGYYTLSMSGVDKTTYTAVASAVAGKSQVNDGNCQVLAIRLDGGNVLYGSGATSAAFPDANRCWAK